VPSKVPRYLGTLVPTVKINLTDVLQKRELLQDALEQPFQADAVGDSALQRGQSERFRQTVPQRAQLALQRTLHQRAAGTRGVLDLRFVSVTAAGAGAPMVGRNRDQSGPNRRESDRLLRIAAAVQSRVVGRGPSRQQVQKYDGLGLVS
jgi:hypothetical protein